MAATPLGISIGAVVPALNGEFGATTGVDPTVPATQSVAETPEYTV
ncbi:hypothetical protein O4160_25820 [Rhodococcus sp. IEGM 1401]|nr:MULTISPECIES: hypothetical protein [unclassified Rhodococcus (in: high G+C Gram-positive bacteria)]MCZ4564259.1 hypothetical protein [Rhodococcus sp. IEGM 1401]MDI9924382.1 hypothetical protein [Rhodococcus sp. IEGM 1372]